jgi:predicted transcriptional regulator
LALKPRYIFPLSFREEDRDILDATIQLAKEENSNPTRIMREALRQYTKSKLKSDNVKLDEFIDDHTREVDPIYRRVISSTELKGWNDGDVLWFAKLVRARKQELESELKRRGYHFVW